MKCPAYINVEQTQHALVMGNNLKAIQTAKALTKKLSSKESHLPSNGCQDFEIPRQTNSKPPLSQTSSSITRKPASRSEPIGKDVANNHLMKNGSPMMNHIGLDSFVYYLPQENGLHSQPQDESMLDTIDAPQRTSEISRVQTMRAEQNGEKQSTSKQPTRKPAVVDLTLDDSDDEQEGPNAPEPINTFPTILAAYSLTENTPFADLSDLMKAKVTQVNESDIVVDSLLLNTKASGTLIESPLKISRHQEPLKQSTLISSSLISSPKPTVSQQNADRTKQNRFFFNGTNRSLESQISDPRTCFTKNGLRTSTNDLAKVVTSQACAARNEVMQDVTNIHKFHNYEYGPTFMSRPQVTTPSDGDDNVIITKVITPSETKSRQIHRRKAPIEVRRWCFEEQNKETDNMTQNKSKQLNCNKPSSSALQDNSTKYPERNSPSNIHREAKIRTLKNLLAKQEKAVERIKTIDSAGSSCVAADRMLVVEIPDLKSELRIPSQGKHSFRVSSQTISLSPKDDHSSRKRPRKSDPRKISRQELRYPSYVESSDDNNMVALKRFKGRQKAARKSRGRNSPKPVDQVPVVSKDLWHRELEKIEEKLALSGEPMSQTSFMMFLGLRKV